MDPERAGATARADAWTDGDGDGHGHGRADGARAPATPSGDRPEDAPR